MKFYLQSSNLANLKFHEDKVGNSTCTDCLYPAVNGRLYSKIGVGLLFYPWNRQMREPDDWIEQINPHTFFMSKCKRCREDYVTYNCEMEAIIGLLFIILIALYTRKRRNKYHSKSCPRCGHYPCIPKVTNLVYKGSGGCPVYNYTCPKCKHKFSNKSFYI